MLCVYVWPGDLYAMWPDASLQAPQATTSRPVTQLQRTSPGHDAPLYPHFSYPNLDPCPCSLVDVGWDAADLSGNKKCSWIKLRFHNSVWITLRVCRVVFVLSDMESGAHWQTWHSEFISSRLMIISGRDFMITAHWSLCLSVGIWYWSYRTLAQTV